MKNFIVIFFAVVLANVFTLTIYEFYQLYKQNHIDMSAYENVTAPAQQTAPLQQENITATTNIRLIKQLKNSKRLCGYWNNEYEKDSTGLNQALKEKACQKYEKLKKAMPLEE